MCSWVARTRPARTTGTWRGWRHFWRVFRLDVPGATVNRLCGSGMDAISLAARTIKAGEADVIIAGGVESMSRAPFVMPKADSAFSRTAEIYDTTIGWRFINPRLQNKYGVDSMPETGENVAASYGVSREDQDKFALRSQQRTAAAYARGFFESELIPVEIPQRKGKPLVVSRDEHPRPDTTLEQLAKLPTPFRSNGTVTAGNASGVNDGACALIVASERAGEALWAYTPCARRYGGDSRRRAANHGNGSCAREPQGVGPRRPGTSAGWMSSSSTKRSHRRVLPCCASLDLQTMPNT